MDFTGDLATVAGLIAGTADIVASRLSGGGGSVSPGNNALQFTGGSFGQTGRAVTLGNVSIYGPGAAPDGPLARYDGQPTNATVGDHERQHTYQWQEGSRFLGQYLFDVLTKGQRNAAAEKAADNGADRRC